MAGAHHGMRELERHGVAEARLPSNAELNPICHLLALLGAHHILHVSRIMINRRDEFHSHVSVNLYGVLVLLEAHVGDLRSARGEFESLASKQQCAERQYRSQGSK
jgi:hypothetical protein